MAVKHLTCGLLLMGLIWVSGCSFGTEVEEGPSRTPNFELTDLEGNKFRLSDHLGEVVLLHFFATDCGHCQEESPLISKLHNEHGDSVQVAGVGLGQRSSEEDLKAFAEAYDVSYPLLKDGNQIAGPRGGPTGRGYIVNQTPTTYVISTEGEISNVIPGSTSREVYEEAIENAQVNETS